MELIGFIKNYATGFGGLFAIQCLIELVLLVNLWNLRSRFKKEKEMNQQQAHSSEMGFQVMAGGSVLVQVLNASTGAQLATSVQLGKNSVRARVEWTAGDDWAWQLGNGSVVEVSDNGREAGGG